MKANMTPAANLVISAYEGGFVNDPKDPGGATKYGITQAALAQHRGHAVTVQDVRDLTLGEAAEIYGAVYWPSIKGDDLPGGVDLFAFDVAVNSGRQRAVLFLQRAVHTSADGQLGPVTLAAVKEAEPVALIDRLRIIRAAFYRSLGTFVHFGNGWLARDEAVAKVATTWAKRPILTVA